MSRRTRRVAWSRDDPRTRVLLECEPASSPAIIASVVERHGYAVQTCEGPDHHGCDLLDAGACALVDGADVVVNLLRAPTARREILDAMTASRRPPAIVASSRAGDRTADALRTARSVTTVAPPLTARALLDAIARALGGAPHGRATLPPGFD